MEGTFYLYADQNKTEDSIRCPFGTDHSMDPNRVNHPASAVMLSLRLMMGGMYTPPWGGWSYLSNNEAKRQTFTDLRSAWSWPHWFHNHWNRRTRRCIGREKAARLSKTLVKLTKITINHFVYHPLFPSVTHFKKSLELDKNVLYFPLNRGKILCSMKKRRLTWNRYFTFKTSFCIEMPWQC